MALPNMGMEPSVLDAPPNISSVASETRPKIAINLGSKDSSAGMAMTAMPAYTEEPPSEATKAPLAAPKCVGSPGWSRPVESVSYGTMRYGPSLIILLRLLSRHIVTQTKTNSTLARKRFRASVKRFPSGPLDDDQPRQNVSRDASALADHPLQAPVDRR